MPEPPRKRSPRERWLRAGMFTGIGFIVVPLVLALANIHRVSGVPEGLRGATHHPELRHQVSLALGSAMAVAFFAPAGVLLLVLCGATLAADEKKKRDVARRGPEE